MDCRSGLIHEFHSDDELAAALKENQSLAPITKDQQTRMIPMNLERRKGYMRNRPCGSGNKFKHCCWSKYK